MKDAMTQTLTSRWFRLTIVLLAVCAAARLAAAAEPKPLVYDVRAFGATGDGRTLDTPAINRAIETANANGGGTVYFPGGTYLCYSIRLKSNVALYLDQAATILAADNPREPGKEGYDPPEPNDADPYEDFGHSHWHNSLIWGENLENISILGPGRIDGKGLTTGGNPQRRRGEPGAPVEPPATNRATTKFGYPGRDTLPAGVGNKAIALKLCKNVIFKDFTIYRGGHFAILATGVDNWTLSNLKIDTNRDGVDLDCCRNVRMSDCTVNSPSDDGICPKSSYALGEARPCENITITNCQVSGWEMGSMLDGTYRKREKGPGTGRIKFGTESNGGFKNITISNCVFTYCRGLALETVDGALLEDVAVTNITMRDIANSPIFLRLGSRLRGPEATQTGELRRVLISNVIVHNAPTKLACIISGVPGHDIEDVTIRDVHIYAQGGGTQQQAATQPAEKEDAYPEPNMFGDTPAYGFFIRHVTGIQISDVSLHLAGEDARPAFVLDDVKQADLFRVRVPSVGSRPAIVLKNVRGFTAAACPGLPDTRKDQVTDEQF
jgi:polygalacturonase